MKRGRLSLPRDRAVQSAEEKTGREERAAFQQHQQQQLQLQQQQQEQQEQEQQEQQQQQQQQQQQCSDVEDIGHHAWPASGGAPISQRRETAATATGLPAPARSRNPPSPRCIITKRSPRKSSPSLSQDLPRSPWSQLPKSRKCALPQSPKPPPSPSPSLPLWPSPSLPRRQEESAVIDLTDDDEPCPRRQGDEARTDRPPPPSLLTPSQPPATAIITTKKQRGTWPAESKPHVDGAAPSMSVSPPPQAMTTAPYSPPPEPPQTITAMEQTGSPGVGGGLPEADVEEGRVRPRSTYLRHFEDTVNTAMRARPDYARLFTPEEREVVQRFSRLSHDGKSLYVRLFQRKGPWFRVDGMLGYDEIGSVTPLWVRRRDAAAATAATSATMVGGKRTTDTVDCEVGGRSAALPLSPFAPAVELAPPARAFLDHTSFSEGESGGPETQTQTVPVQEMREKGDDCQRGGSTDSLQKPGSSQPIGVEAAAAAATTTIATEPAPAPAVARGMEAGVNAEVGVGVEVEAKAAIAFTPQELTVLHADLQSALCELVEAGFLEGLPDDVQSTGPGLEAALAAVECCVRSPEMKVLLKRTGAGTTPSRSNNGKSKLTGRRMRGGARKGVAAAAVGVTAVTVGGRRGMVEELRRRLAGQQTLWGAKLPLVREVERLVSASVEASGVEITAWVRRGGGGSSGSGCSSGAGGISSSRGSNGSWGSGSLGGASRSTGGKRCHWMVLVAGRPRLLFKRVLRLIYLTCDTGALSSGRVGAASVTGAGGAAAMSSWSPGLSAAFGKTRYEPYTCKPRVRAFRGREDFLRWEAAVELRCALDGAMEDLPRGQAAAAAAAAVAAAGAKTEEGDGEDEDEGGGQPSDRPGQEVVVVLDSYGELEDAIPARQQDRPPRVKLEADKGEEEGGASGGEDVRDALGGLEDSIAQFYSAEDRGRTDGVAFAAAGKATSAAEAIALVCSHCLHAHLGTSLSALSPRAPPPPPVFSGGVPGSGRRKEEKKEEQEMEGEEVFLCLLREVCGGGRSDASGPPQRGSLGEMTEEVQEEASLTDATTDDKSLREEPSQLQPSRASGMHCGTATTASKPQPTGSEDFLGTSSSQPSHEEGESSAVGEGSDAHGKLSAAGCASPDSASVGRDGGSGSAVPEFLLQLEAGWVLASAVWEGVALLERARDYERAVELLAQLLATRFTSHRRGRWWNRLSLDLAHTGRLSCALWAAREGLRDPRVRGGDRLALEKRSSMLSRRASNRSLKVTAREPAPTTPSAVRSATVPSSSPSSSMSSSSFLSSTHHNAAAGTTVPDADRRSDDGDNDDDEDDEDDIFQDPAVERERRRKHSRRRQKKKRRLQRQPPPPPLQQLGSVVGSPADVGGEDGGGCCTTSIRSGYGEKPCDDPAEAVCSGSAATAMDAPPIKDSRGRARDCQVDEDIDSLGKGGRRPTAGSAAASASVASTTTAAATAAAASTVAAISGAAACGGLAELSLVPGILKDESVGAVVAAAGERGEADQGGAGVPEMSIAGRRLNKEIGVKSRFVGYGDGAACTVEDLVLQHLSQREEGGWAGWHCEGSPVRGLWALLMWDVLFMDVPEVFQTPYQDAPLDLDYCPLFYLNRRAAVDARLAEIRAAPPSQLVALVGDAWLAHENTVCRGLNWARASVRHLQTVAAGLGGVALAAILAALCLNYKHFGGGLPDLLLMRAVRTRGDSGGGGGGGSGDAAAGAENAGGAAEPVLDEAEVSTPRAFVSWLGMDSGAFEEDGSPIVGSGDASGRSTRTPPPPLDATDMEGFRVETWLLEVKGPSDRLSDRQTAWLRVLRRGGARVGVCHVAEGSGGSHAAPRGTGSETGVGTVNNQK